MTPVIEVPNSAGASKHTRRPAQAIGLKLIAVGIGLIVLAAAPLGNDVPREPHDFLRTAGRMTPAQLTALDNGQPVARVLDTDRREVAVVGAVRIRAARSRLMDRYRDVESLRKSNVVLEVGTFGTPPRAADLRSLPFELYDLESVRECEPGDCPVRLSSAAMTRFQQSVDWNSPGWPEQAAGIWREILASQAAAYLARGDDALPEYQNKEVPLRVHDEFAVLYAQSSYMSRMVPDGMRYIREFPDYTLPGVENLVYWSKEDFGLKPVTSITHLTLYDPPAPKPGFIAAKRIYATHYFDAGLGLTIAHDDGEGGFYLISMNRARTRSLTSRFRGFVRSIVQSRSKESLEKLLAATKRALEPTSLSRQ